KASLRLAVRVGSICEEEGERGLAHFLEHMVFRGTQNYSDGEVVSYLESIGARFGADTNAYTTYDETVYMFEVPLDKEGALDKALSILSEMAMQANLATEQLEIEKGVVLDELRMRGGLVQDRITKKILEVFLQNNLYGERSPIGLEKVIQECTHEKLYNFYKKWYHPKNMAIVATGDFNGTAVEASIHKYFDKAGLSEQTVYERPHIEPFQEDEVVIHEDPEMTMSYLVLGNWRPNLTIDTEEDFKTSVIDDLIASIANRRLQALTQQDNPPFKGAGLSFNQAVKPATLTMGVCACWDEAPLQGLQELLSSYKSMQKQLFTQSEFDITLINARSQLESALENGNTHKNKDYVERYVSHFLHSSPLISFEDEALLSLKVLDALTLEEINVRKNQLLNHAHHKLIYMPSNAKGFLSKEDLMSSLISLDEKELVENKSAVLAINSLLPKGTIDKNQIFEGTEIKKIVLGNGMQVYLQKSNLKENHFNFKLEAPKGISSYDESSIYSAMYACHYGQSSGLAGLSSFELQDALAGRLVNLSYYMGYNNRVISGSSTAKDAQMLFKLLQALFVQRTYRDEAWKQAMKSIDEYMVTKESNSSIKFLQKILRCNRSNHYFFADYNSEKICQENAQKILGEFFSNPSEFVLTIVGDYPEEDIRNYLETYLASIPTSEETFPEPIVTSFKFPEGVHECFLDYVGATQESSINLTSPIDIEGLNQDYSDFYKIELAKTIIQARLLKTLRTEAGETYGVQAQEEFPFYPSMASASFAINFSASPEQVKSMTELTLDELKKVELVPPTSDELKKALEIYKHSQSKALNTNQGKLQRISDNLTFGKELDSYLEDSLKTPSQIEVHEVMKRLINLSNYTLHVKNPIASK
ncbi:MAG: insulinase family protein, partial [Chlamydiota bacterium]